MESAILIKIDVPQRKSLANDLSDRLSPTPPPPHTHPQNPLSTPMEDWKVFWSTSKL